MMTIELLDEAMEDIVDGGFFYRQQVGDALKDYFVDSIFASIDRLSYRPRQLLQYLARHGRDISSANIHRRQPPRSGR